MEPTRPLGVQWPSVRALKKIDKQGLFADFRQHLEMEIRLNGQKIRTGVAGAKKRSRKVKRKVLKEERWRVEKRPLSRLRPFGSDTLSDNVTEAIGRELFYRPLQLGLHVHVSTLRT